MGLSGGLASNGGLSTGASLAQLPTSGLYLWHRGGQATAPEQTFEAFRNAMANGAKAFKLDAQAMADGTLMVMHDSTVDRTTNGSGNVSTFSSPASKTIQVDAGSWFAPAWSSTLAVPLIEEILAEFGGRVCLYIESKSAASTAPLIAKIQAHGLQNSVMCVTQDATLVDTAAFAAAGLKNLFLYNNPPYSNGPTTAAVFAAGATQIGCNYTYTDADITTLVAASTALGQPTHGFTLANRFLRDRFLSLGVGIYHSNDPVYLAATTQLLAADKFTVGTPYHGEVPYGLTVDTVNSYIGVAGSRRRAFLASPSLGFEGLGFLCPIAPTTYTISTTVTFDTLDTDTSRHADIMVCAPDDAVFIGNPTNSGYNCLLRQTGDVQVFKQVPGSTVNGVKGTGTSTQLATTASTAITVAGTAVPVQVTVTPTTVTMKRTDTNATATATDNTYRGGYAYIGKNGPVLAVSYSALSQS